MLYQARRNVYRRVVARPIPRTFGAAMVLALAMLALTAPAATAQATCTFDEATGVVQVNLVGGTPAVLARDAEAITLDTLPCQTATVANTGTILVAGTGTGQPDDFTVDLAGGPFEPGTEAETDGGTPEIDISVDLPGGGVLRIGGSDGNDVLTLGSSGANLNAAEAVGDPDLTLTGPAAWSVDGGAGDDTISIAGGGGTGEALAGVTVHGGGDADTVLDMAGGSTVDGGEGIDTIDYSAAEQVVVDLSAGAGQPAGGSEDSLFSIEDVVGTAGADWLVGDRDANVLSGGDGNDLLDGGKGADTIDGGQGSDTVDYARAKSVSVDLTEGTATGLGTDTLSGIEDVRGSDGGDVLTGSDAQNTLLGRGGDDEVDGHGGRDTIVGALGNDLLSGGIGGDILRGGRGKDQLDGGDGHDTCIPGPDPDSWTGCETVKL
jgi:Ca2+-binding RTX toxin-like protein